MKLPLIIFIAVLAGGAPCLTEAQAPDSGASAQTATIEGPFGKAEVNLVSPSLTTLYLRGPQGLTEQSLLSTKKVDGTKIGPWTKGGYTYVLGPDGRRYESHLAKPDGVEITGKDAQTVVKITGVKLVAAVGEEPVVTEDWTLSAPGDGSQLVWKIMRHWQKDFTATLSASPSLFFMLGSFSGGEATNSITTTIWCDPLHLSSSPGPDDLYVYNIPRDRMLGDNHVQTARDRDSWMIYKMWTNWHAPVDLRLEVKGGYLYRRGVSYGLVNEVGAVADYKSPVIFRKGQTEELSLGISGVDKYSTGYQLSISLPDKATEASLKDFYGSLLNGGTVCDQKDFDFGNESDGFYYAGESWMSGAAMAAGVPAPGQLSAYPYDVDRAYREHLAHIFSVVDAQGRSHFGYDASGVFVDDNLSTMIGAHFYLLHSGDVSFIRQNLPVMEQMLGYFIKSRNEKGLFQSKDGVSRNWYYDAILHSELTSYYNAFFYKASLDMAEMETACGRPEKAAEYTTLAQNIKKAFNEVFWKEDAPGGPRYIDWIYADGRQATYFCDICQWPALAFGLASPEQGRKLLATADAQLAQLGKEYGYQGFATLSALWPAPKDVLTVPNQEHFGDYMNGGSLLAETYWEILARARYGDPEGAARRLKLFAHRASEISWVGSNSCTIKGEMTCGDGEPYLADMIAAPAAVINGVLGITPTWDHLEVTPHLPADWPKAEADVLYKGRKQHVTIDHGRVSVEPGEQVINLPLLWVMDFNLHTAPTGVAITSNIDYLDNYEGHIALTRVYDDHGISSLWKLDETQGPVLDASPHQTNGEVKGQGTARGVDGHAPSGKAYSFDGHGWVEFPPDDTVFWLKDRSANFTLQCWFKTDVTSDKRMGIVFKPGAYNLSINNGKLFAALTDSERDGIARGATAVADGKWHHAAAIFDRKGQRLSLYLDGKLDAPDGNPTAQNPADLTAVGVSTAFGAEYLGAMYGIPSFIGSIDEVSLSRGLLAPSEFSFQHDYPSPVGKAGFTYAATGSYQSPSYDWGVAARLTNMTVTADLNGGEVSATVETSNDGFKTIASTVQIPIRDSVNTYSLASLDKTAQVVRVRLDLRHGPDATQTPMVDAFQITAQPAQ